MKSVSLKGSISVFLAIIFMVMVMLTGTIIDIIRIVAAERDFDSAVSASARSVLASYNQELAGEYGLYGVDTKAKEELKKEFFRYINLNLNKKVNGILYTSYEISYEKLELEGMLSLINQDELKQQILEYMKYRAPINITEGIISKLKEARLDKSFEFAQGASDARKKTEMIKGKVKALNSKIDDVGKKLIAASENELSEILEGLTNIKDLSEGLYGDDGKKLLEEIETLEKSLEDIAGQNGYENIEPGKLSEAIRSAVSIGEQLEAVIDKVNEIKSAIDGLKVELVALESELEMLMQELKAELENNKDKLPEGEQSARQKELEKEAGNKANAIELIKSRIDMLMSDMKRFYKESPLSTIKLNDSMGTPPSNSSDKTNALSEKLDDIKKKLTPKVISRELLINEGELKAASEAQSSFESDLYMTLGTYEGIKKSDKERENDNVLAFFKRLISSINDTSRGARDKLYIIEYAMDKFTFLTSKTPRAHFFKKGEVEYIISGSDIPYNSLRNNELLVITDVLSKIWFLRFSIDSISHFVKSKIPHPIARLGWSLLEGAIDATSEMIYLLNGDYIDLLPGMNNIKLRYSDHLRMLLLLQSEDETLRKIQQLIQVNTINVAGAVGSDFRLGDCSTSIKASCEVKVKLLFLPLLKLDTLGVKGFSGDSYIMSKSIIIGY